MSVMVFFYFSFIRMYLISDYSCHLLVRLICFYNLSMFVLMDLVAQPEPACREYRLKLNSQLLIII